MLLQISSEEANIRRRMYDMNWHILSHCIVPFFFFSFFSFAVFLNRGNKHSYFFTSSVYNNNLALLDIVQYRINLDQPFFCGTHFVDDLSLIIWLYRSLHCLVCKMSLNSSLFVNFMLTRYRALALLFLVPL